MILPPLKKVIRPPIIIEDTMDNDL